MGSIFNCMKKETKDPEPPQRGKLSQEDKAILDFKLSRYKIKNYIKRLEVNEKTQKEKAKDYLRNKQKDKAKYSLSQSKMYKIQAENSQNQLSAIEDQINRLDSMKTQKEVFMVLENTNKVLLELQKEVNVEKLEKISDDLSDIKANSDEITNFFKNHNVDIVQNEEEINKEIENLMKMEAGQIDSEMPDAGSKKVEGSEKKENLHLDKENEKVQKRILIEA